MDFGRGVFSKLVRFCFLSGLVASVMRGGVLFFLVHGRIYRFFCAGGLLCGGALFLVDLLT